MVADFKLTRGKHHFVGTFMAMAGPCEILLDVEDPLLAHRLTEIAFAEARRIEAKFSRYQPDSIVQVINTTAGSPLTLDEETSALLDFANTCWTTSNGRFDITAGILRQAWTFAPGQRPPTRGAVKKLLPHIGWDKAHWQSPVLTLPAGMEIDFGGLGKEYAVDRAFALIRAESAVPVLVNFGGDLRGEGPTRQGSPWHIGVENPGLAHHPLHDLNLKSGALATSGDARRFILHDGKRYGHILNPRTGWPSPGAPRSVTVLGDTCLSAGVLATVAMVHGRQAEAFLEDQKVQFWVARN